MVILLHVLIALASLIYATCLIIAPSQIKFRINTALIAATFASGAALIIFEHAALLRTCASGLSYLAVTITLSAWAKRRYLAKQED